MNAPKSFSLITILFLLFGLGELAPAMYNPATGSFLSRDPIEERGGENLYGFARNDAANKIDFFGLEFADRGIVELETWDREDYGITVANITLHLKCQCVRTAAGGSAWVLDVVKYDVEATAYVILNSSRFRPSSEAGTSEKVRLLRSSVDRTKAHEELHLDHFRQYHDAIDFTLSHYVLNSLASKDSDPSICEAIAGRALKSIEERWNGYVRDELLHKHAGFADYERVPLKNAIDGEWEAGWTYSNSAYGADGPQPGKREFKLLPSEAP